MKKMTFLLLSILCLASCGGNIDVQWVASTAEHSWQLQIPDSVQLINSATPDAVVHIDSPRQTIDGFGTCFNELGWTSLSMLNESDREAVMKELFAPGIGAGFTVCRLSIGANDFARNWYSYNEVDKDFEMAHFDIANDRNTLIPFIKNALKYNPDIRLWASPWSPPTWMKDNGHYACQPLDNPFFDLSFTNDMRPEQRRAEGMNMFIQEDAYFKAYALYFSKFIEAYRQENINISMVMPQNEFNSCQPFPSCTWTAAGLNRFVGRFLGPQMRELGVELMFGTMERPNPLLVDTLLSDPESAKFISGVGFQWAGKRAIGAIHAKYPALKLYQTEQECGNGKNDWGFCCYAWTLLKHYLNSGANVYEYWNTALEEGGMSRWGWRQNSLVTVDAASKTYKFTYEYYLMKHVSHYVTSGAQVLPISGAYNNMLAFRNADGSYVLLLHNDKKEVARPVIRIGDKATVSAPLPPESFSTIVIK